MAEIIRGGIFERVAPLIQNHGRRFNPGASLGGLAWARKRRRAAKARSELREMIDGGPTRKRKVAPPMGQRRVDKAVLVMVPGRWYTLNDVVAAIGLPKGQGGDLGRQLRQRALATRVAANASRPEWGFKREWVYQLTERGEALAAFVRLLL